MAINPESRYPGQVNGSSGAYPLGSARDVSAPGAGDGTPWQADLVNDLFGFQQALLAAAGITASGTPDQVGASQYLQALQALFPPPTLPETFSGSGSGDGLNATYAATVVPSTGGGAVCTVGIRLSGNAVASGSSAVITGLLPAGLRPPVLISSHIQNFQVGSDITRSVGLLTNGNFRIDQGQANLAAFSTKMLTFVYQV